MSVFLFQKYSSTRTLPVIVCIDPWPGPGSSHSTRLRRFVAKTYSVDSREVMKYIRSAVAAALAASVGLLLLREETRLILSSSPGDTYRLHPHLSFNLTAKYNASPTEAIRPLWSCNAPHGRADYLGTKKKLGFVHVFKTAGSTLGNLLQAYASKCHAGYGRLVSCTSVRSNSLHRSPETNGTGKNWEDCVLKKALHRDGTFSPDDYARRVNNSYLSQELDIVGGHYRLGSLDSLNDTSNVRYLTFVRDAATKFVSGALYRAYKNGSYDGTEVSTPLQLYNIIRGQVSRSVQRGEYHFRYQSYLLTPEQKENLEMQSFGIRTGSKTYLEHVIERIKQNLVEYNVIIGSVELMSESLELLSHVIDPDGKAEKVFVEYGMCRIGRGERKQNEGRHYNRSPLSANTFVRYLRKDANFSALLDEYVKYEQQITDFGVEMHLKQYDSMQIERMKKSRTV